VLRSMRPPTVSAGRCWTIRGAFADGQIAEHGGELIDQGHTEVRHLANELGLTLDNLLAAEPSGTKDIYGFDDQPYTFDAATRDLKGIWQQIHSDVSAASYPALYTSSTQRGRELDALSIARYIDLYVPGGRTSKLGQLLDVAYNIEYGAETTQQSSLNLLYLLAYSGQGQLLIFGPSNEKYRAVGGNDQIPQRLAQRLQGQITLGSALVAIRRNTDGTYALTSTRAAVASRSSPTRSCSRCRSRSCARRSTMARPASTRSSAAPSPSWGWGPTPSSTCSSATATGTAWATTATRSPTPAIRTRGEVTRAQPGASGILVDYTGGTIGASFGTGTPTSRAQQFLAQLEPVLPCITAKWSGRATADFWTAYPWTKGSYSYWKVGQYPSFAGAEREQSFDCHFAGEHTSIDFQGYLNGGVETGQRAATEILDDLRT
jgi:monoamine oxidase